MLIWYILLAINFVIVFAGLFSHIIFVKRVLFRKYLCFQLRLSLSLLSLSMFMTLATFLFSTILCLFLGTMFQDETCQQNGGFQFASAFLHGYAEMLQYSSHLLISLERIVSICCAKFYKSRNFNTLYTVYLIFQQCFSIFYPFSNLNYPENRLMWAFVAMGLMLFNIFLNIITVYVSRQRFLENVPVYNLRRKHELYSSYEISRALILPTILKGCVQMFVYCFLWLQLVGFFFASNEVYKILFINDVTWNLTLTVFPWFVLSVHRGFRQYTIFSCRKFNSRVWQDERGQYIRGLDGNKISLNQSQGSYFEQLNKAWGSTTKMNK